MPSPNMLMKNLKKIYLQDRFESGSIGELGWINMGGDGGGRIASGGNPGGFLRIYASTQGQGNSQFYLTGLSTYIGKRINIDLKDIATSSVYTAWYTTSFGAYISNWVNSTSPSVWTTYSTIIPASADILYIDVEGYDVDSFCGVDNLVITD